MLEILREATHLGEAPGAGREVMNTRETANYLRMSSATFAKLATTLPRHRLSEQRHVYLRSELLSGS
jgi:hypothetical protein